jgi:hypothetical protein
MLMVVFGAGASFDSDPRRPALERASAEANRPPLADQLFDNRPLFSSTIEQYPACHPVITYLLTHYVKSSVEQKLEYLQAESSGYAARISQLAAIRFYLRHMLRTCTDNWLTEARGLINHKTFFDQIQHHGRPAEGVCVVTFNYDTIIERGLASIGVTINDMAHYTRHANYKLFKLHGSVDWMREIDDIASDFYRPDWGVALENRIIEDAATLPISQRYVYDVELQNRPLFPAIAIPVEHKSDFECPEDHVKVLQEAIPRITKIICIGWRATEEPFLQMLRERLKSKVKLLAVTESKDTSLATIDNISNARIPIEFSVASEKQFTEFVATRGSEEFLKQ